MDPTINLQSVMKGCQRLMNLKDHYKRKSRKKTELVKKNKMEVEYIMLKSFIHPESIKAVSVSDINGSQKKQKQLPKNILQEIILD